MTLTKQLANKLLIINQVRSTNNFILHKLNNIGITPGNKIIVLGYHNSKSLLHVQVYNVEYVLRASDCKLIDVSIIANEK